MAEALLRAALGDAPIVVSSAGLAAEGVAPPRQVAAEMRKRGLDVTMHRSRRLEPHQVEAATLVIGAARTHAWEAVAMVPDAITHTFTYKELIRLGDRFGACDDDETFAEWAGRLHEGRRSWLPANVGDDIPDPIGGSRRAYARVAAEIERLTQQLALLLIAARPKPAPSPLRWRPPNDWHPTEEGSGRG